MATDNESPVCVLCGISSPGKRFTPVGSSTQFKFLQQIQTFSSCSSTTSFLGLSVTPLCEMCVCDVTLATENGEEVTQGEEEVRRLQMELLSSLRQLSQRVDKYLEGMRRLEENVRRAENWTNEEAVRLRSAVFAVVRNLSVARESISNRIIIPPKNEVEEHEDLFSQDDEDLPLEDDFSPGDEADEGDPLLCTDMDYSNIPPPQNPLEDNSAEVMVPGDVHVSMLNPPIGETSVPEKMEMEFYSDENDEDDPDYIKSEQESSSEPSESDPEWEMEEETNVKKKLETAIKSKKSPPKRRSQPQKQPPPPPSPPPPANSILLHKEPFVPDMEALSKIKNAKEKRAAYKEQEEKWRNQELICPICQGKVERRNLRSHMSGTHKLNVIEPRKTKPRPRKPTEYVKCEHCDREYSKGHISTHLRDWHGVKAKAKFKNLREACPVCGKIISRRQVKRHMLDVHGMTAPLQTKLSRPSTCDLCRKKVKSRSLLVKHLEGHVGPEYVIRCPNTESCSYVCVTQFRMRRHLDSSPNCWQTAQINMEVWRKDQMTCPECGTVCTNQLNLRGHLLRFHETADKPFACPMAGCEMRFTLKLSVVLHLAHHDIPRESKTQACIECKEEIPLEKMADHLKEKHGAEEIIKCTHCPFQFGSREHLVDHLYEHRHSKLYCDICGPQQSGSFTRHSDLATHYFQEHKIGKEWRCDQCPNVYFKENSLKSHQKKTHNTKPGKKLAPSQLKKDWQCEDCGQVLKSEESLRGHKIREHGAEPFGCSFCTEKFSTLNACQNHERRVHKGVKKQDEFPCTEAGCGAVFKVKKTLKFHVKEVHLGEKGDHVCEECGKAYRMPGDLKNHREVVHLGIRKYKCEVCGEAFASSEVLRTHRRIHTGERPFACDLCGQRFRQKVVLLKHKQGHMKKGEQFRPNGPMKQIRKRVERAGNEPTASTSSSSDNQQAWNFLSM